MLTDEQAMKIIREYIAEHSKPNSRPDMNSEHHLLALSRAIERAVAPQWISVKDHRPTDATIEYIVNSSWGVRSAMKHSDNWARGCFQDVATGCDEGQYYDDDDNPFVVFDWTPMLTPPEVES